VEITVVKDSAGGTRSHRALRRIEEDPLGQFLAGQLTERTRKAYYADICEFFDTDRITPADVRAITFTDIIDYRNGLEGLGRKHSTINRKLSSLKAFFRMMIAAQVIEQNPADSTLVRGFRVDETLVGKSIDQRRLQQIFNAVDEEENELHQARDRAILYLLTYGGLRRSEVANVSWADLTQDGAFYILSLPTTKSGVPQDVKLQPVVIHFLQQYRDVLLADGYDDQGKAFISLSRNQSHGKPLTDQSINHIVRKYALRAGLDHKVTAHMFRHTCCTLSIEGGAKPQQVQAHLRHKDLKTTMRYYENRERLTDNASDYIRVQ
jgi:site-specific recombinase XerD